MLVGARQEELARAAAEGAAWVDFQRMAAWWLGENANVATDEYAGSSGVSTTQPEDAVLVKSGYGRVVISTENKPLSAGEVQSTACDQLHASVPAIVLHKQPATAAVALVQVIALQATENPAMMAVVSQLQHAIMTMPWPVRCAAAQATAKVRACLCDLLLAAMRSHRQWAQACKHASECTGGCTIRGAVPDSLL